MKIRFKHLDESIQQQLDEVRLMSDTVRPGEGHRWIHNAKSLRHHISHSQQQKMRQRAEQREQEEKTEPHVDSDWGAAIKLAFDKPKHVNTQVEFYRFVRCVVLTTSLP
jgi:hypothetical protein